MSTRQTKELSGVIKPKKLRKIDQLLESPMWIKEETQGK